MEEKLQLFALQRRAFSRSGSSTELVTTVATRPDFLFELPPNEHFIDDNDNDYEWRTLLE